MSRVKKSRGSKFLALVVALTFLLSMAAPAFAAAPADLQKTEANRLQTLGIIAGFPDGSLGLDKTMTRAEFAKVITIATGNEIIADAMVNSPTKFPDAKAGVWYTGYVNVASELGYILGYPDGTFKPNEPITNAEVLTILLRALGYDDKLPGSWPTDYLVKANELDLTDDVTFAAKAAALRGDAFIFTSRTLDTNMVTWDSDANEFVERDPAITLLAKALKGTTEEGYLANLSWDNNTLKATIAYYNERDELKTKECKVVSKPVIVGADSVLDLLAKKVSYVLNSDDQIIYFDAQDTDVVTDTEITFYDNDTAKIDDKYYDLADGWMQSAFPTNLAAIAEDDGTYTADKVTAVLDGGDIIFVLFEEYENPGIVESIDDNYINVVSGSSGNVDLEDEDYAVIKDGVLASLNDLKAGDLVYVIKDTHDLDYLIVAESSDNAISGTLEDIDGDYTKITVDGVEYDVDSDAIASSDDGKNYDPFVSVADDFAGQDVNILLSPAGLVAAITSDFDAEPGLYGILLNATVAGFDSKVKVLTAAGDKTTFDLDEDEVEVKANVSDKVYEADTDDVVAEQYDLIKYGLNSKGEIDSIEAIEDEATVSDTDKDNNRIQLTVNGTAKWYRVSDTTAFFGWGSGGTNDWTTTTWSNFADVGEGPVNYDLDGNTVTAIVYHGQVTTEGDYGVILKAGRNVDGPYYKLMVFGEEVTYNLASESAFDPDVVGEVYEFTLNADNEISLGNTKTATKSGIVDAFSANNYIKVKVNSDVYYYDFDDETSIVDVTGTSPKVVTTVGKDKTVDVYVDSDGFVDYIVIVPEEEEVVTPVVEVGIVTYINTDSTAIEVGGELYYIDEYTVLRDSDGNIIAVGATDIDGYIVEGDSLRDVVAEDGVIDSMVLNSDEVVAAAVEALEAAADDGAFDAVISGSNVVDMAQAIVDDVVDGVTVTLTSSTNNTVIDTTAGSEGDALAVGTSDVVFNVAMGSKNNDTDSITVTVVEGEAWNVSLTVDNSAKTATATVTDENGNEVEGITVYFSSSDEAVVTVEATATTDANGEATVDVTEEGASNQSADITAEIKDADDNVGQDASATANYTIP